ncbi:MAG TPA: hypothetical protein VFX39_05900, partial [Gemmatimonadaceae bacterium]|nr:hypothetical protein [Gemmatimonadaceae bacterium]
NLVPVEAQRWEALADCDRVARAAEARASSGTHGLARTASGLELLRVGGLRDEEIANWRYGRRLRLRQRRVTASAALAVGLAVAVALWTGMSLASPALGGYLAVVLGAWALSVWHRPPRLWLRVRDAHDRTYRVPGWRIPEVRLEQAMAGARPTLVLPRLRGTVRLEGADALRVLADLLPKMNAADSAVVNLRSVLAKVREAETTTSRPPRRRGRRARRRAGRAGAALPAPERLRPWEWLGARVAGMSLRFAAPERRLALEMAVTEERERLEMRTRAEALAEEWHEEEEVGRIADDLLLPDAVAGRLRTLRTRHEDRSEG